MRRSASEIINALEMRIARLEKQSAKEPQWITWAIETLLESDKVPANSISDLKVGRNGKVWSYASPNMVERDDVITVRTNRKTYIIYENDDVKSELNDEIMESYLEKYSAYDVAMRFPWAKDIIGTVASLPYGDIELWSSNWASLHFEGMDDEELIELAGLESEAEEYEDGLEYWSPKMDPIDENGMPNPLYSDRAEVMVYDYNNMLNELPERARFDLVSEKEEQIKSGLRSYPLLYLTDEWNWSEKQVFEAFGYLDEDEIKEVVKQLGASEPMFHKLVQSGKLIRTPLEYRIEEL